MAKSKATFNKKSIESKKKKKRNEKFERMLNKKSQPKATFEEMLVSANTLTAEEFRVLDPSFDTLDIKLLKDNG